MFFHVFSTDLVMKWFLLFVVALGLGLATADSVLALETVGLQNLCVSSTSTVQLEKNKILQNNPEITRQSQRSHKKRIK